jgi:ComF family protein
MATQLAAHVGIVARDGFRFCPSLTNIRPMSVWSAALDVLYPPRCPGCGRCGDLHFCAACLRRIPTPREPQCEACGLTLPSPSAPPLCAHCNERPPAFRRARACATYDASEQSGGPLRAVLHRFKYERDLAEAAPLAALLAERCPLDPLDYDLLLPVPLHLQRLRWRGFNQAQLLALPLARRSGLRIDPFALERTRSTDPQVRLDADERRRNVRDAFRVTAPERVRGRRVLLVDDVYTSGATADACGRALMRAGATVVDVLALAHAVLP